MRNFLIPLTLLLLGTAMAQSGNITGQVAAVLPTPDGAMLRWFPKNGVLPAKGFKLYRSGGGQDKVISVASPQPKATVLKQGWMSEKEYDGLVALFQEPASSMSKVMVSLRVLSDANWSKALGLFYTDSNLKPGAVYAYRVVAVGANGESEIARFNLTPGPSPAVPTPKFEAKALGPKVSLSWRRPPGEHFVLAYRVYRAKSGGPLEVIQPDPYFPNQTSKDPNQLLGFSDEKVQAGLSYYYTLSSIDAFGRESPRAPLIAVDLKQSLTLQLPDLTLKALNKKVQLEWTRLDSKQVESVVVLRGVDPDKPLTPIKTLDVSATSYVDTQVNPGLDYYYALAVKTGNIVMGPGPLETVKVLNLDPPAVPAGIKAVAGKEQIQLSWSQNLEGDLWGYIVLRSDDVGDPIEKYIALNGTPIAATTYRDLLPGSQAKYVYRIVAVNTSNVRSKPSEPMRGATANLAAPPAPQLLTATPAEGSIALRFASGYVPDLAKIEIYRSDKGEPQLIATLKPTDTTYTDKAIKAEAAYTYTVRSVDSGGLRSAPSNALTSRALDLRPATLPEVQGVAFPGGGVRLVWKAEVGVKYAIYRLNEDQVPIQISDLLSTGTFNDPEGGSGSTYLLKALDASGNLSTSKPIVVR